MPLSVYHVRTAGLDDGTFAAAYGLTEHGAALVRPTATSVGAVPKSLAQEAKSQEPCCGFWPPAILTTNEHSLLTSEETSWIAPPLPHRTPWR